MGSALEALNGTGSDLGVPRVLELLEKMDTTIPVPERDADKVIKTIKKIIYINNILIKNIKLLAFHDVY